jgi:putative Mg2+ transporter-C (MgtC) family protein
VNLVARFGEPSGQGWTEVGYLAIAFGLSALIGFERELRQRSAGLRTHALVGVASALFMLVSKYGFTDVLGDRVILDPSRVAAQVVSGIGFIGAGLIFVRRDSVRGLTTAATIWLTAAVGMAAGAGLPVLACLVTGAHFLVVYGLTPIVRRVELFTGRAQAPSLLRITYRDREGILRRVLALCTQNGLVVSDLSTDQVPEQDHELGVVSVNLRLSGAKPVTELAAELADIPGVLSVNVGDAEAED